MDPTSRWRALLQQPEPALDEGALVVAAHAGPAVDIDAQRRRLDDLSAQVAEPTADAVGRLLFDVVGLQGDEETYDDPRNSFLDQVLDRRRGIPITLSIVMIEVARRCGVGLRGVGMPGHFLVLDPADPDRLIDPFGRGRRMDRPECRRLFHAAVGPRVAFDPSVLGPEPNAAILARVLNNLDRSYRARGDLTALSWVTTLRAAIPGQAPPVRLELADTLLELGRPGEALDVLGPLLAGGALPPDLVERASRRAATAHSRLN